MSTVCLDQVGVELAHEQWQQDEAAEANLHKMLVTKCNKLLSAVTLAEDGTGKLQVAQGTTCCLEAYMPL